MRLPTAATLALLLVAPSLSAQTIIGAIPHLAAGGPWATVITVVNTASTPGSATLLFWDDSGQALYLPIVGIGMTSGVQFTLAANGSATIQTDAANSVKSGWAALISNVTSIDAIEVFRNHTAGRPDFEASVPLIKFNQFHFVLPFDHTAGFFTGIALANPAGSTSSIRSGTGEVFMTFRDENGSVLLLTGVALPPGTHTAFLLANSYPVLAGKKGTVEFTLQLSDPNSLNQGSVFATGLRFDPAGAFTSIQPILLGVTECIAPSS